MTDTLYETDFVTWTERQAAALREAAGRGSDLPIDWANLAEEIEDVGKEILNKVESLTEQIQIHLLKIACSAFDEPRAHREGEVDEFRSQLARRLRDNHAIRSRFSEISDGQFARSLRRVDRSFKRAGEPEASGTRLLGWKMRGITSAEVLEDGLYPVPEALEFRREPD